MFFHYFFQKSATKVPRPTEFNRNTRKFFRKIIRIYDCPRQYKLGNTINASQETVKKLLQNLINSSYDLSAFGTHTNWLSLQYESVNADIVIPKIRDVLVKANKELRVILNAPEHAGKDVVWAGLVADSLLKNDKQNSEGVIQ